MINRKFLCLAAAIALATATLAPAQSLTELAKQEKERQAKARAAGTTATLYTGEARSEPAGAATGTLTVTTTSRTTMIAGGPVRSAPAHDPKLPQRTASATGGTPAIPRVREVIGVDRRSSRDVTVVMYMTSWCPYCRAARAFLNTQRNVRLVMHDIEADPAKDKEMLAKTGGSKGIPVLDVEGRIIQGFSEGSLTRAIEMARGQ